MQRHQVVHPVAVRKQAGEHGLVEQRPALVFRVIVRAETARHEAEALRQDLQLRSERIRRPAGEPADSARASAGHDGSGFPRLAEHGIQPLAAPHVQHVGRVPAADVDHVEAQHERPQVPHRPGEQPQVERDAPVRVVRLVEAHEVGWVVADGGAEEQHPRPVLAGEPQHVLMQRIGPPVHHHAARPGGHDMPRHVTPSPPYQSHHAIIWVPIVISS
jgi:hypothetical protein